MRPIELSPVLVNQSAPSEPTAILIFGESMSGMCWFTPNDYVLLKAGDPVVIALKRQEPSLIDGGSKLVNVPLGAAIVVSATLMNV